MPVSGDTPIRRERGAAGDLVLAALDAATAHGAVAVRHSQVVEGLRFVPGGRGGDAPADRTWRKTTATRGLAALLRSPRMLVDHAGGEYRLLTDRGYQYWMLHRFLDAVEVAERGVRLSRERPRPGACDRLLGHVDEAFRAVREGLTETMAEGPRAAERGARRAVLAPTRRTRPSRPARSPTSVPRRGGSPRPATNPVTGPASSAPSKEPRRRHREGPH
jgi:hypothetical protein